MYNGHSCASPWKIHRLMKGVYFSDTSEYQAADFEDKQPMQISMIYSYIHPFERNLMAGICSQQSRF